MMKAVYISGFSENFDLISLREVPEPDPVGTGEVLVRVCAAGVNRADLLQAWGAYPPPPGYSTNIPGLEFAGVIVSVGSGVPDWEEGDRVFGITAGEAHAEYLCIHHRLLMRIPDRLSFHVAAAVPEAFITAHDAVIVQGGLVSGEVLLIHAVGSGVGLAALQMAKSKGAKIIGTSRTQTKLDRCISVGLEEGINLTSPDDLAERVLAASDGRGSDVILDLVGASYFHQNVECLAPKGRLLLVGLTSGSRSEINLNTVLRKRATIIGTVLRGRSIEEKAAATKAFADDQMVAFESGSVRPIVDKVFSANQVAEAYRYVASNKNFGKVILDLRS
jgi:NADPH2:quinone reductase